MLGKKLPLYPSVEEEVMLLGERVAEALRMAKTEMKELDDNKGGKGKKRKQGEVINLIPEELDFGIDTKRVHFHVTLSK